MPPSGAPSVWRNSRPVGAGYALALSGAAVGVGAALDRATRRRPGLRTLVTAAATWTVLGGTSLGRAAGALQEPSLATARPPSCTPVVAAGGSPVRTSESATFAIAAPGVFTSTSFSALFLAGLTPPAYRSHLLFFCPPCPPS